MLGTPYKDGICGTLAVLIQNELMWIKGDVVLAKNDSPYFTSDDVHWIETDYVMTWPHSTIKCIKGAGSPVTDRIADTFLKWRNLKTQWIKS